jgi:hypothetical protein
MHLVRGTQQMKTCWLGRRLAIHLRQGGWLDATHLEGRACCKGGARSYGSS